MLLPVFTGSRPVPQPKWGYGVNQRDLSMLQPLRDVVQRLLCDGLTGVDLMRTFVSHRVQPLRQREMTMLMYLGPSCPDRPFSAELDDTEIYSPWVSLLKLTSVCLCQFLLLNAYAFLYRILGTRAVPHGGSPYLRMQQGGRPTVSTMNGYGNGGNDVWRASRSSRVRRSPA
jgi:hypothetical protein